MGIIVRKHSSQNTNYNQLKGSGILPRNSQFCKLSKCQAQGLPTPNKPTPKRIQRNPPEPLCATKLSPKDNKWVLNKIHYPDFNTLWVNIPNKAFTILKTNG